MVTSFQNETGAYKALQALVFTSVPTASIDNPRSGQSVNHALYLKI